MVQNLGNNPLTRFCETVCQMPQRQKKREGTSVGHTPPPSFRIPHANNPGIWTTGIIMRDLFFQ